MDWRTLIKISCCRRFGTSWALIYNLTVHAFTVNQQSFGFLFLLWLLIFTAIYSAELKGRCSRLGGLCSRRWPGAAPQQWSGCRPLRDGSKIQSGLTFPSVSALHASTSSLHSPVTMENIYIIRIYIIYYRYIISIIYRYLKNTDSGHTFKAKMCTLLTLSIWILGTSHTLAGMTTLRLYLSKHWPVYSRLSNL